MRSVDNRIVNMQFNNGQFEGGVHTSIKSLEELKKSLNLDAQARSLENLNNAGKNFNLSTIADGVQKLADRFSTMGIIGMTVISNLTTAAMRLGNRLADAIVMQPIKQGFSEYELKMNSIQTILTNTERYGTKLPDVNKALDELNTYADMTIYNFAQMTDNVGKFTAAGLNLNDAVTVVKGMGNTAAAFGVDAVKMAGATYQMSQALAAGRVQLMDWRSMELAGMGGMLLQEELLKTAKGMNIYVDDSKGFRYSLEQGWLTADVFIKTMDRMAKDPALLEAATKVRTFTGLIGTMKEMMGSGWATTWEKIIGDSTQAAELFTSISDVFTKSIQKGADARNAAIDFWNVQGGRADVIAGVTNILKALSDVISPIQAGFANLIPDITGERLVYYSKKFREFTEHLKVSEETTTTIKRTFGGFFAILDFGKQTIINLVGMVKSLAVKLSPLKDIAIGAAIAVSDMFTSFNNTVKASGLLATIGSNLTIAFGTVIDIITSMAKSIALLFNSFATAEASAEGMVRPVEAVGASVHDVGSTIESVVNIMNKFATGVNKALTAIRDGINNTFDFSTENLEKNLNTILFSGVVVAVTRFIWILSNMFKNVGDVAGKVDAILGGVAETLEVFQKSIKANIIRSIAVSIAILAAALVAIAFVDQAKLIKAFTILTALFVDLFAAMGLFSVLFEKGGGKLIFANLMQLSVVMIAASIAILILAKAVRNLSSVPWQDLVKGLIGVGILLAEIAVFSTKAQLDKFGASSGAAILLMAGALLILSYAIKSFGKMKPEVLLQGLLGVAAILGIFAVFANSVKQAQTITYAAFSLLLLGTALKIIAGAIEKMGTMQPDVLGKGLAVMGASLLMLAGAFRLMPKEVTVQAAALLGMAVAIRILASAMVALGSLSIEQSAAGILALAGIFGILAAFLVILAPLSSGLMVLAGAIALLGVGVLGIGLGLSALAVGLGALAISGAAGARALVDVVRKLLELVPEVFGALAQGLVEFVSVLANNAPVLGEKFKTILIQMITDSAEVLKTFFTTLLDLLTEFGPQFIVKFLDMLTLLLEKFAAYLPRIIKAGGDIVVSFLKGIASNTQRIVELGVEIVSNLIKGLATSLPRLIQSGFNLIVNFINGLAEAIRANVPLLKDAIVNLLLAVLGAAIYLLTGYTPEFTKAGNEMVNGFIDGIGEKVGDLVEAAGNMAQAALNAAKEVLGISSPSEVFEEFGMNVNEGFALGLRKYSNLTDGGIRGLLSKIKSSFQRGLFSLDLAGLINKSLENVNPTIRPVVDLTKVNKDLDTTFNQPRGITTFGASEDAGFINKRMSSAYTQTSAPAQPNPTIQTMKHTGTIRVEGVNNDGQLIAVIEKTIDQSFTQGNRRIPTRVTTIPSMA